MTAIFNIFKALILGIVEGITEWLPISSTGHMILVDEFLNLDVSFEFMSMFLVVIQLGAIMAVVMLYFKQIFPFKKQGEKYVIDYNIFSMWFKIIVACIPAIVVALPFDELFEKYFYNFVSVAIALIVFGVAFIFVENKNVGKMPKITKISQITYKDALIIGIFQLIAGIFPGTSRSGATILGGIAIGLSRTVAAEFTFFLAIPTMFGASVLKILKFGLNFSFFELVLLIIGMLSAYLVSVYVIKFLMTYIKKHDFKFFGWYRIVLGAIVLLYFIVFKI